MFPEPSELKLVEDFLTIDHKNLNMVHKLLQTDPCWLLPAIKTGEYFPR
jgi:hypothetical protein